MTLQVKAKRTKPPTSGRKAQDPSGEPRVSRTISCTSAELLAVKEWLAELRKAVKS